MKLALVLLLTAIPTLAQANPFLSEAPPPGMNLEKLFAITSDRDSRQENIHIMFDDRHLVTGVYGERVGGLRLLDNEASNIFWLRDIESEEGALLMELKGYKVAFLKGALDRASQEGMFHIRFLTNALSKTYKSCDFQLKTEGAHWYVKNAYTGARVNGAKVTTWSLGIKTIEGICPN